MTKRFHLCCSTFAAVRHQAAHAGNKCDPKKKHGGWSELTGLKCAKSTQPVLGVLFECAVTKDPLLYAAETLWMDSDAVRVCTAPLTQ